MSEPEFEVNNINALVENLLSQAADANLQMLESFANIQNRRAARLADAEARLKADLGENHPQVVALHDAAAMAAAMNHALETIAVRTARRPKVKENEWLVFGRVLDANGNPVSGVRVRIFDRDRIFDDLLGITETDEYGDFAITYHERDFAEPGEGLPELYLMLSDTEGNLLYSSRDNIRYNPGRAEYFEILLPSS
ncbi:transthyretin-like family protein [Microseira wollei]|uniref:Retinal pigment epithelial membrane protein n=1 Tax=Microseira wollei NIES-4236 TaxID=2530354 RepID=A0AAV3XFT9_9CYAN|nr:transthyretin-like family protein [Microseira wollei]GET39232.1 retinal pigment epithelial membrane protein [Microseira wollei NIES-4236]